jgi:hypothetical protein
MKLVASPVQLVASPVKFPVYGPMLAGVQGEVLMTGASGVGGVAYGTAAPKWPGNHSHESGRDTRRPVLPFVVHKVVHNGCSGLQVVDLFSYATRFSILKHGFDSR